MNYPLISDYIGAIKSSEEDFEQLKNLHPVLDDEGLPIFSSGNFAVVFKMRDDEDKFYAVKCFLKDQEGRAEAYRLIDEELKGVDSPYLTSIHYLDKELFVDTSQTTETEFPVLLMDWVEGKTLDKYLRENLDDKYALEMLAYRFSQLAQWLIPQPFAHGDLKPDNILVREDGTLVLVDYDGMYVPAMKGQKARELGSPDFRHPSRTEDDFDEHIDDFPIVSILLSLKAISISPQLLDEYGASDRLLFSKGDYQDISSCGVLDALNKLMNDSELAIIQSLFILASSQKSLSKVSYQLFDISEPKEPEYNELNLEVTDEDLENAWVDEYGVKYSKDRKRLLKAPEYIELYSIRGGTIIICRNAFNNCRYLDSIKLPNSVKVIGSDAFSECISLRTIMLSELLVSIGDNAFSDCFELSEVTIPDSVVSIGEYAFEACASISNIKIPKSITRIESNTFWGCFNLSKVSLPNTLEYIGRDAFGGCTNLKNIEIPDSVIAIGPYAFYECRLLKEITIPTYISTIGSYAFSDCTKLERTNILSPNIKVGEGIFRNCSNLNTIIIPNGTNYYYEEHMSEYKYKLVEIDGYYDISNLRTNIVEIDLDNVWIDKYGVKYSADKTRLITVPKDIKEYSIKEGTKIICDCAFDRCDCLERIEIPETILKIGIWAFAECAVRSLIIPSKIVEIGDRAFWSCKKLENITLLNSRIRVGFTIFDQCDNLRTISIPNGSSDYFRHILREYQQYIVEK